MRMLGKFRRDVIRPGRKGALRAPCFCLDCRPSGDVRREKRHEERLWRREEGL